MKDSSASETLLLALPVLLVLLALVGAVIFFPSDSILDIRGKAAPITVAPTRAPLPTASPTPTRPPETVCSELYNPVCGANGVTYANECEAGLATFALPTKPGVCPIPTPR